ncbi:hypothetical protein J6590_093373, partial [Homalodisca vitripennis]
TIKMQMRYFPMQAFLLEITSGRKVESSVLKEIMAAVNLARLTLINNEGQEVLPLVTYAR